MIAVIDSGSGGANIIKECLKYFKYDFIYLVDNKNCPYGNLPINDLKKIILNNIKYLLDNYSIDFIIIGCNTASSVLGFDELEKIQCPILKTYPDLNSLVNKKGDKLLFATKNTIMNSNIVKYYLKNYKDIQTLYIKDLPKIIDNQLSRNTKENSRKLSKLLKKHLIFNKKLKKKYKNIKNIALGCTHFKYIENLLNDYFNNVIYVYCENEVAKLSRFLIKKNKDKHFVKVVLTQKDDDLKNAIERMFY